MCKEGECGHIAKERESVKPHWQGERVKPFTLARRESDAIYIGKERE